LAQLPRCACLMVARKTQKLLDWENLSDEDILNMRVRDLGLQVQGSLVEPLIGRLYGELEARRIQFHPPCYLADEWLCPDKVPIIGIPFCLAHPRLKHIEQKMMYEVEGATDTACMKLLRHECGHALNYAYELYKRTRWRQLFGPFTARYSDSYYFRPYSRRYVVHLDGNYAQMHPDEDFAETFAVWLAPGSDWRRKYAGWPAMKKLCYVDTVMSKVAGLPPVRDVREKPPWAASRMTSTLAAHYQRKRRALGSGFQGFYDDSLRSLFSSQPAGGSTLKASGFLRRYRRKLVNDVAKWTGHRKFDIHELIGTLIGRCDALDLYAGTDQTGDVIGLSAFVTAVASNTLRGPRMTRL